MRELPRSDPGVADHRSAGRLLWWMVRRVGRELAVSVVLGVVWMCAMALAPALIGIAIDRGVAGRDLGALAAWSAAVLGLGMVQALAGVARHRYGVHNWLDTAYGTVQLTVRQSARLGAALPRRMSSGEVVSIGVSDIEHLGEIIEIIDRAIGAFAAIAVVTVIMLGTSTPLGLVVLIGVPLLLGLVALLLRPLQDRQEAYRTRQGALTTRAADIVTGLRVLRGVGGEALFAGGYRAESQDLRAAGVRVGRVGALLEATQVLLPGLFLALVVWLGARLVLAGDITAGQLVAFFGYTAFLVPPLRTLTEAANALAVALVAARRVVRLLELDPDPASPARPVPMPPGPAALADPRSGLLVRPGELTAIAAADPADAAAIAERLARFTDSEARLGDVPLRDLDLAELRSRVLLAENEARLFAGPLREALGGGAVEHALETAAAEDIVAALPDGLDTEIAARGREFSGGQQQRLRLARALVADPETLILVEPTSAVDAHTEARIAGRLGAARAGRTTVVCTTSPLVLAHADRVAYVEDGKVIAEGTHRELLTGEPRYAATVTRQEG
ncbi:ABC transporter ATP-binding protein [Catenuloplanes atrovinosus]|uniref:ABC-type multidrug transport system fused ATPase/permease subunit n=1 Tax=Catenuloplanes atrovinosus TaxID=137266 RepID=A0AAE3YW25_9ACTN|nr:ABC transporter ATP-binding protein [Catenuloplanes atrovinosus]MDR7279399.1 ABC-type multidrug transport system fused ATPase/permease subunit [Catenuloplanes atrovinosus]